MRSHENSSENLKQREWFTVYVLVCWDEELMDWVVRFSLKDLEKDYEKTEDDIKAVQSVGQIIGEVMKQLDTDRCASLFIPIHQYTHMHA